jgi:thymidylate synthase
MKTIFDNANQVFDYYYDYIVNHGVIFQNTRAVFNVGVHINNPMDNHITSDVRNWKHKYAHSEWLWYLSGDRSIHTLGDIYGKVPKIWTKMADSYGNVNSNYGYQWDRNDQLDRVINMLKQNKETRQASISIYDGKEIVKYKHDTPCTYAINFMIHDNKLNMSVMMRSNDLWYGFCNDQYCFSILQENIANSLKIPVGWYYHFVNNMHLYESQLI